MTLPAIPASGSTDWYAYAQGLDTSARTTPRLDARARALSRGGLPTTMTAPPTVTTGTGLAQTTTGTTGSTLTAPVNLPHNTTGRWRFLGGVPWTSGAAYYFNGVLGSSAAAIALTPPWSVEFMHEGAAVEFAYRASNAGGAGYRIMVDGQWAGAHVNVAAADGLRYLVKLDFGSRAVRRIRIQFDRIPFGGLNHAGTDTVWITPTPSLRGMILGDSYTEGTGATTYATGLAGQLGYLLGWDDPWINGESGTGYMHGGTAPRQSFPDRLAATVTAYAPDVLVVFGGINDNLANSASYTNTAVQAAATALYESIGTALPRTDLFVVGVASGTGTAQGQAPAVKAAAEASARVAKFIDPNATDKWITGTGRVGATTGNGNADVLISDGTHPSQAGHDYYARRIAAEITSYYQALPVLH